MTHALAGLSRAADPGAIVIFGGAGDLTKRKLFPALYNLKLNGLLPKERAIVGGTLKERANAAGR
jgi:glucose-6-phosphate 1-dehydrogenase